MGPRKSKRKAAAEAPTGEPETEAQTAVIVAETAQQQPPPIVYTAEELRHFAEALPMPTADDKKKAAELVDKYKAPGNHAKARLAKKIVQSRHGETQMPWAGGAEKFLGGVSVCLPFFSPLCVEWNLGCQSCKLDRRAVRQQEGVPLS